MVGQHWCGVSAKKGVGRKAFKQILEPGSGGGFKISEHQLLKIKEALSGKVLSDYIIDIDTAMIKIPRPLSPVS